MLCPPCQSHGRSHLSEQPNGMWLCPRCRREWVATLTQTRSSGAPDTTAPFYPLVEAVDRLTYKPPKRRMQSQTND